MIFAQVLCWTYFSVCLQISLVSHPSTCSRHLSENASALICVNRVAGDIVQKIKQIHSCFSIIYLVWVFNYCNYWLYKLKISSNCFIGDKMPSSPSLGRVRTQGPYIPSRCACDLLGAGRGRRQFSPVARFFHPLFLAGSEKHGIQNDRSGLFALVQTFLCWSVEDFRMLTDRTPWFLGCACVYVWVWGIFMLLGAINGNIWATVARMRRSWVQFPGGGCFFKYFLWTNLKQSSLVGSNELTSWVISWVTSWVTVSMRYIYASGGNKWEHLGNSC